MGQDVYAQSPAARAVYSEADSALDAPISNRCFGGPTEALTLTANTQPALVATSLALLAALRERLGDARFEPFCAAGHSLGEYSALVAAGALGLGDAVRLVRHRGEAMQNAVPPGEGAMAAVMGMSDEAVDAVCREATREGEVLEPANFNGAQTVIAGTAAAVMRAVELVASRKGKAVVLKVSAPFHCALMAPAVVAMREPLDEVAIGGFAFPVVSNVDARPNRDPARVRDLLARQIDGPVRWEATIRWMAGEGVTHALEVGPGKVLAGLVKRIEPSIRVLACRDVETIDAAATSLASL